VMQSGFDLENAWQRANELDDTIESHVAFAFDEKLGYLTACPTNVGTGVRVSVMLHLPALVITREIERVFRGLERINLAVRGLYGEGSQALGDFYQISNQITLGRTENELMSRLSEVVEVIIDYEKKARKTLLQEGRSMFHDRISRAYGILQAAQTISSEETMHHLSGVRLGLDLGLIEGINTVTVNQLFLGILPAHLQKRAGETLDAADRDVQRAKYLREKLGHA